MNHRKDRSAIRAFFNRIVALVCAAALTLAFFLVLPLMQTITQSMDSNDLVVREVGVPEIEPPPQIEEEEEPPPEEETPEQPKLETNVDPATLDQMIDLGRGAGIGTGGGTMSIDMTSIQARAGAAGGDSLASIADLDQRPRPTYRVGPRMTAKLRKRTPGKVYVIFIVDEQGRVVNPKVERSSDPIFNQPAINAVKRWRFEPGKRGGRSVRFRMRVPITFPKSR